MSFKISAILFAFVAFNVGLMKATPHYEVITSDNSASSQQAPLSIEKALIQLGQAIKQTVQNRFLAMQSFAPQKLPLPGLDSQITVVEEDLAQDIPEPTSEPVEPKTPLPPPPSAATVPQVPETERDMLQVIPEPPKTKNPILLKSSQELVKQANAIQAEIQQAISQLTAQLAAQQARRYANLPPVSNLILNKP